MGTRNLTMVISGEQTKVAQYGQWDGYPEGQGKTILEFLQKCDLNKFKEQVNKLRWITDQETEEVEKNPDWDEEYPYLSRNAGGQILGAIHEGKIEVNAGLGSKKIVDCEVKFLVNSEGFAADSLFCEWAYVVDLDKNTFEVYSGFNQEPLNENERFHSYFKEKEHRTEQYHPVKFVSSFPLENLPTTEAFLKSFIKEEEESENN